MHFFGDPSFPKRNLRAAGLILALMSFEIGTTLNRVMLKHGPPLDYLFLALYVALLFVAVRMFQLGLASVPADPGEQLLNQSGGRSTMYWIRRLVLWAVIIITPVLVIQYCAGAR
jgi:hypothetical protein